jgi:hypothetical protein
MRRQTPQCQLHSAKIDILLRLFAQSRHRVIQFLVPRGYIRASVDRGGGDVRGGIAKVEVRKLRSEEVSVLQSGLQTVNPTSSEGACTMWHGGHPWRHRDFLGVAMMLAGSR